MTEKTFWNKRVEILPMKKLEKLQLKLLKGTVERVYRYSKFYRARFKASKIEPAKIRDLKDIEKLLKALLTGRIRVRGSLLGIIGLYQNLDLLQQIFRFAL